MPTYQAIVVTPDGKAIRFHNFFVTSDGEAKLRTERFVDGYDVELWLDDTIVKRFPGPQRTQPLGTTPDNLYKVLEAPRITLQKKPHR